MEEDTLINEIVLEAKEDRSEIKKAQWAKCSSGLKNFRTKYKEMKDARREEEKAEKARQRILFNEQVKEALRLEKLQKKNLTTPMAVEKTIEKELEEVEAQEKIEPELPTQKRPRSPSPPPSPRMESPPTIVSNVLEKKVQELEEKLMKLKQKEDEMQEKVNQFHEQTLKKTKKKKPSPPPPPPSEEEEESEDSSSDTETFYPPPKPVLPSHKAATFTSSEPKREAHTTKKFFYV